MSDTCVTRKLVQSTRMFHSAREACRYTLRSARTTTGRFLPVTVAEVTMQLLKAGFLIHEQDVAGLLRDIVYSGEAIEIDSQTGFRWLESAA